MKSYDETRPHDAREMTKTEILDTFKLSAKRHVEQFAGFDGVEIHGANHYLIQQFVSPYYNRRNDVGYR